MIDGPQHLTGYPLRDYDDLITRLGRSRESKRISQRELAIALDASQSSISDWLAGKTDPHGPRLVALADALGYDLALIPRKDASQQEAHCDDCGGPCRDETDEESA